MAPMDSVKSYYCDVCEVTMKDNTLWEKHLTSQYHFKKVEASKGSVGQLESAAKRSSEGTAELPAKKSKISAEKPNITEKTQFTEKAEFSRESFGTNKNQERKAELPADFFQTNSRLDDDRKKKAASEAAWVEFQESVQEDVVSAAQVDEEDEEDEMKLRELEIDAETWQYRLRLARLKDMAEDKSVKNESKLNVNNVESIVEDEDFSDFDESADYDQWRLKKLR